MRPNSPELDEHGFPIPPTFAGAKKGNLSVVGRFAWRAALVLVFLVLLGSAAVREGAVEKVKEHLAQHLIRHAEKQARDDDLDGALKNLNRAVAWAPDDVSAHYVRANVRLQLNDLDGSLSDFNRLIEL